MLELRAAAGERLMIVERLERLSGFGRDLAEVRAELARLRGRGFLGRLLGC